MSRPHWKWPFAAALLLFVSASVSSSTEAPAVTAWLDRYVHGEFDAVTASLDGLKDFGDLLDQMKRDAPAWIDAGGPGERQRRTLAAATFALEAARADEWREWKWTSKQVWAPPEDTHGDWVGIAYHLYWKPPAQLIEWACERMRQEGSPTSDEHVWGLASLAVAERAEDFEFLVGNAFPPQGCRGAPAIRNLYNTDVIQHVRHLALRFPDEPRFKLAQAIAEEWHVPFVNNRQDAQKFEQMREDIFQELKDDVDVGGEATTRLGYLRVRQHNDDAALALFKRVPSLTRDPWVISLAAFLSGQLFERRSRPVDAEAAYRRALAATPRAESPSVALAGLLFRNGHRAEAATILDAMTASVPLAPDPWRGYADADDRFWPTLIAQLHERIRR